METQETIKKQKGGVVGHTKSLKGYYFLHNGLTFANLASLARYRGIKPCGLYDRLKALNIDTILKNDGYFIYKNEYFILRKSPTS